MYNSGYIIVCAGAILSLLLFFGFIAVMRYINYKETLSLAEKGLVRPEREPRKGKGLLIWGVMIIAVGLALCLGLYPLGLSGVGTYYPLGLGPWMLGGLLPLFIGIGLVLVYVLTSENGGKSSPAGKTEDGLPPVEPPAAPDEESKQED